MATAQTPYGPMKCLQVIVKRGEDKAPLVAQFGGIPLRRKPTAVLLDTPMTIHSHRTDLLARMLADTCELCGSTQNCEVHHIRKLARLGIKGRREKPDWVKRMIAMRRKTLVVCHDCHRTIHAGRPVPQKSADVSLESRVH